MEVVVMILSVKNAFTKNEPSPNNSPDLALTLVCTNVTQLFPLDSINNCISPSLVPDSAL